MTIASTYLFQDVGMVVVQAVERQGEFPQPGAELVSLQRQSRQLVVVQLQCVQLSSPAPEIVGDDPLDPVVPEVEDTEPTARP